MQPNSPISSILKFLLILPFLGISPLFVYALDEHLEDHDGAHLFMHETELERGVGDLQFFFISNETSVNAIYLELDLGQSYKDCGNFAVNKNVFPLVLENTYDHPSIILALASPGKDVGNHAYIGHIRCKKVPVKVSTLETILENPSNRHSLAYLADGYGTEINLPAIINK